MQRGGAKRSPSDGFDAGCAPPRGTRYLRSARSGTSSGIIFTLARCPAATLSSTGAQGQSIHELRLPKELGHKLVDGPAIQLPAEAEPHTHVERLRTRATLPLYGIVIVIVALALTSASPCPRPRIGGASQALRQRPAPQCRGYL